MKKPIKKALVVNQIKNYAVSTKITQIGGVVMSLKDALEYDHK